MQVICVDCKCEVTSLSPRWTGPRPRPLLRLRPDHKLDAETLAVLDSARRAAREVAGWPSWKAGRCNCPRLADPLRSAQDVATQSPCIAPDVPNRDADCPTHLDVAHYVVVRADLPHGSQVAQTIHAAGESAPTRCLPGTIAVALHARDERHLRQVADRLGAAGIPHHLVEECDGEAMAIGVEPTTDRAAVRRVLSQLPLVR